MIADLSPLTVPELLSLHAQIGDELRERRILRSFNNPTSDLAELLFCRAFGWQQAGNSNPLADAKGEDGELYQIKARRITPQNPSRQLGALRRLPERGFDYLGGVLFGADYSVMRAALIPHVLVLEHSTYVAHTNSWKFLLRDVVWTWPGVDDVTAKLKSVQI